MLFRGGRKNSDGPIGVDIGDHTIRMIQFARDGEKPVAVAAASRPLGQDITPQSGEAYHQAVTEAVRDMLATGRFRGQQAVSCLPAASLVYKNIRLPKMPYDELASAVEWEASERLRFRGEAMSVQFFDAGEVLQGQEKRQEVIMLAAPQDFINEHIQSLKACEVELRAITAVPSALARCIEYAYPEEDQDPPVRIVIDAGYTGTKVLLVRGSRILFFKLIEIGGRHMDEALAAKLRKPIAVASEARRHWMTGEPQQGLDDDRIAAAMAPVIEELSREIGLCLRYYSVTFRGRRPEEAWVIGGEAGNAWLWVRLCQDAGLKPAQTDPLEFMDLAPVRSEIGGPDQWSGWGVAVGLALHDTEAKKRKRRGAA